MHENERHLPYHEMIDAFASSECPICFLLNDRTKRYLNEIAYECGADKFFRVQFNASGGFCNTHAYEFFSIAKASGLLVVYESIIEGALARLFKGDAKEPRRACLACDRETKLETQYVQTIKKWVNDRALKDLYERSNGLCFPHYRMLLRTKGRLPDWVIDFQRARYERFLRDIRAYLDGANGGTVWQEVIPMLNAYSGKR